MKPRMSKYWRACPECGVAIYDRRKFDSDRKYFKCSHCGHLWHPEKERDENIEGVEGLEKEASEEVATFANRET